MREILIETSGEIGYLAILQESKVIEVHEIAPPKRQSEELLPLLSEMIPVEQIKEIAIGIGPGAFTGTRIGAMCAKTLAFAKNIPLIPFCSLEGCAPKGCTAVTDAKAGYLYLYDGETPQLITPEQLPQDRPLYTPDPLLAQKHKMILHPFSPTIIAATLSEKPRVSWQKLELLYLRTL